MTPTANSYPPSIVIYESYKDNVETSDNPTEKQNNESNPPNIEKIPAYETEKCKNLIIESLRNKISVYKEENEQLNEKNQHLIQIISQQQRDIAYLQTIIHNQNKEFNNTLNLILEKQKKLEKISQESQSSKNSTLSSAFSVIAIVTSIFNIRSLVKNLSAHTISLSKDLLLEITSSTKNLC